MLINWILGHKPQHPSPITQKLWDPRRETLFGCVFKFCFHHSILWFLSDKLWKLKTHFRCFQVIETELWWHFCKYTHIEGPTVLSSHFPSLSHQSPSSFLFFSFFFSTCLSFCLSPFSVLRYTPFNSFFLSFFPF